MCLWVSNATSRQAALSAGAGEVRRHRWPLGVQRFGERGSHAVTYIGIPALDGNTWPLRWYSEPTPTAPYVDAGLLTGVVTNAVLARPAAP
jgi:hypothetical protein